MNAVLSELHDARAVLSSRWESGRCGGALPVVVALHDRGFEAETALADARRLFGDDADVAAPQAARPCNPLQSGFRGAAAYAGYSWYLGTTADEPEPASFGDALAQVLLFIAECDRACVLHGRGQSAVLAMAASRHAPGSVVGLAIDETLPACIAGWEEPSRRPAGVPLLQVGDDAPRWLRELATSDVGVAHGL